ncbi:Antibiotic biosynthesis monooxygenase [Georgfuchsia toluolica]|uniref:Antibiotic biosynthesis monooxygenase n=1 Tax=Georgfuchsia toluolica TaxID=424218 RepID=A0A916J2X7_9PROT|nr:antibiotic biosynthesis monooxygenase [Georgfuchsia toluolica]CAG4883612.1 Antibiotic biosynthesis monooxygenase [Georgfuchsia toluolica]
MTVEDATHKFIVPNHAPSSPPEHVFFVVRHKVKAGAQDAYENWTRRTMKVAARFPGHLGVRIMRPPSGQNEYVISVRFESHGDAGHWYRSKERRALMDEMDSLLDSSEQIDVVSGIDYWFTPASSVTPPRWKQWLLTTTVIWPLTVVVPPILQPAFDLWPLLGLSGVRHGLIAAAMVALVTYVIMPRYTRLFAQWLYKK